MKSKPKTNGRRVLKKMDKEWLTIPDWNWTFGPAQGVYKRSWIDQRSKEESLVILKDLSGRCAVLGGKLSAEINSYVQHFPDAECIKKVMDWEVSYDHIEVRDACYARQILALFQKSQFITYADNWSTEREAARRFVRSERECLNTNRTLVYHASKPHYMGSDIAAMMFTAQRKIASVLGKCPSLEELPFSFGPGANTNVLSTRACPRAKLSAALECSSNLSPTVGEFLSEVPQWMALHDLQLKSDSFIVDVSVVPGKVMFVPKNSKTDRSIVVEPLLNSFFQKGFGSYIRERLLDSGINLRDQTANQRKAKIGSITGRLATCDISMASDCIARELVWSLLPYDWAEVLDRLRSGTVDLPECLSQDLIDEGEMTSYMFPSTPYAMQKFSSMGNGFTFELESLIFYGLCHAACVQSGCDTREIGVYGDDLIVPTAAYVNLVKVLSYCGFTLNKGKSYADGRFRESCGADFLDGFDIRPFYQKTLISDRTLFSMHNWFLRQGEFELASAVKQYITPENIIYGPNGYGDGHLIGSYTLRKNRQVTRSGWEGGYFDTYVLRPLSFKAIMPGDAVLPVYSVYTRSGQDSPTDPNRIRGSKGYAKVSIYTLATSVLS